MPACVDPAVPSCESLPLLNPTAASKPPPIKPISLAAPLSATINGPLAANVAAPLAAIRANKLGMIATARAMPPKIVTARPNIDILNTAASATATNFKVVIID